MQRVKTATATTDNPGYTDSGTPGFFKTGDPLQGIPATVPGAEWFNMAQEELVNAILAAGLELDPLDDTQLLQAIQSMVSDSTGNLAGVVVLSAASTLTESALGKLIRLTGASAYATTLPLAAGVVSGSRLRIVNNGTAAMTVARQGTDSIYAPTLAVVTSLSLSAGDSLDVMSDGTAWYILGGTVALKYASGAFGYSNSYQRLPSGLILQWGSFVSSAAGDVDVTFPLVFPTALRSVVTSPAVAAGTGYFSTQHDGTVSGFKGASWSATTTRVSATVSYVAFGN